MRNFLAAIAMLSILPVGRFTPTEKELRNMVNYYPAAGLLFAGIFYLLAMAIARYCPPLVGAMLLTILPEVLTKGIHLDGLADTADGFLSGRSRERKLEIMRDSHIGVMGVGAIFATLGLKFSLLASLPAMSLPIATALMILGGRVGIVWHIAFSRYARNQGLAKLNFECNPVAGLVYGTFFLLTIGFLFFHIRGLFLAPILIVGMFLWSRLTKWVINGATGDTIGCAEELAELLLLATCVFI